ncbi:MAG TPA: undecaprenyl-phosphate glucose phosphotransferase [Candidatus Eisenbergiella merdipullorum]|uniref:Undecaprenyl-phosphate glucose phosphotransferase n=1 Tax=Candidatus Eisenbergiella merdipullorum TaxID=2838553 RepID=A0A9D2I8U9_9FIRM|nr:undecaprenyl-phosphate glucose phosphotransferase [Candidatus Eisenbergiella merdipullorum]
MIKDNQQYFNRLHVIMDALVIAGSYILAWYLWIGRNRNSTGVTVGVLDMGIYFSALYFVVPGYLILYYWFKLYSPKRVQRTETEILNVFKANIVGMTIFLAILFMAHDWRQLQHFSRGMVGLFTAINTVNTLLMRAFIRYCLHFVRKKGYNRKYILLVGYSRAAEEYINRINSNPQWGYVVRGILDDKVPRGATYKGVKVLGSINNLLYILPENKLDEIAITLSLEDYNRLEELVDLCEKSGVHTKFIPDYTSLIPGRPYMEDLMGLPVINIRYVPLTNTMNAIAKRLVDIAGSFFGLILISPLLLVVAILVKTTSPGPVIFKQERVGLHNKPFLMYKFRTMHEQKPDEEKEGWTVKGDPRITKVGAFLRRTSIDELPQLFNVLKGDMSLVGPRPERPQFVEKFREEIPRYMIKHQVRPGMTGWAQINGYRGDTSIRKRIEYDIYYIENWSMAFDIKILFLTFFKGFINENAY